MGVTSNRTLINGSTVNATAAVYSEWVPTPSGGKTYTIWYLADATTSTTPSVNIDFDYSPFELDTSTKKIGNGLTTCAYNATDTTLYETLAVATTVTTEGSILPYTVQTPNFSSAYNTLAKAFKTCRVVITGTGGNGADTKVYCWLTIAE